MNKGYSIIRNFEYEKISKLNLNGKIMDIGGSKKSGYHSLIKGDHKIDTVNIDPEYGCDLVFDIQEKFPIKDKEYSAVICFNVLEHIFEFHNVFRETNRVLKKDGLFVIAVPFLFHIHGSPDDYFRYTKSCLIKILKDNSFSVVSIEEIGYGLFSLFFQIAGGAIPGAFLRRIIKNIFVGIDKILCRFSGGYKKIGERIPLGYFVVAKKDGDL